MVCMAAAMSMLIFACSDASDSSSENAEGKTTMGILPTQTPELLKSEFELYRSKHPELSESEAQYQFDVIQVMSKRVDDPDLAAWAERKALARAWLKKTVEEPFSIEKILELDNIVERAIDAYAYNTGHPALVTASHILVRPDKVTTAEQRREALEKSRQVLLKQETVTDEDLEREGVRLTHAGFRVDVNSDLTFPAKPIEPFFFDESSTSYRSVVQPFADAAFSLSAQKPLSEVTESEFGYHLVLFKSRTEEKKGDPVKDRDFVLNQIHESVHIRAAQQQIQGLYEEMARSGRILEDIDWVASQK